MVLAKLAVASASNNERARADVVFMHGIIEQVVAVGCSLLAVRCWLFAARSGFELLATGNSFSLARFLTSEFWTMWRRDQRGARTALSRAPLASDRFRLIQTGSMDVFSIAAHDRFVVG